MQKVKPIILNDIWYATDKHMNSIWNAYPQEDTGELMLFKRRIKFTGKKFELSISDIIRVYFAKKTPNYGVHIISFLISMGCVAFTFLYVVYSIEYFLVFTIMIITLYPVSLFGVRSNWIGLEYLRNDLIKRAYFSDGSYLGFQKSNKDDGSLSLYEDLKILVDEKNKRKML